MQNSDSSIFEDNISHISRIVCFGCYVVLLPLQTCFPHCERSPMSACYLDIRNKNPGNLTTPEKDTVERSNVIKIHPKKSWTFYKFEKN